MKKLLISIFLLMFFSLGAEATTTFVQYNNAGSPVSVTRGAAPTIPYTNSILPAGTYSVPARVAMPVRPVIPARPYGSRYSRRYYNNYGYYYPAAGPYTYVTTTTTTATIPSQAASSRFSRNTGAYIPRKTYTRNGVTYYN